jgi:hypothetical protein
MGMIAEDISTWKVVGLGSIPALTLSTLEHVPVGFQRLAQHHRGCEIYGAKL